MRILFLVLFTIALQANTSWNYDVLLDKGFTVEIICKNGYLTERISLEKGYTEETYCYDKSTWDGDCLHPPVKCDKKDEK